MWNDLVWISNIAVGRAMFRFSELFWQHPVVGAMFMAGFLTLAVLFWVEILKDDVAASRGRLDEATPIRLWR